VDLPTVVLEREIDGEWIEVTSYSGRPITDTEPDILLSHTPDPLYPYTDAQEHRWWAGWQAVGHVWDRAGVPEGSYRLHVYGQTFAGDATTWPWPVDDYEIVSDTFEVLPVEISLSIEEDVLLAWIEAPTWGYRLVDMDGDSHGANPVHDLTLTWLLEDGSETSEIPETSTDNEVTVAEITMPEGAVGILVEDRYGNLGQLDL
jgi:hypothetical protein